MAPKCIIGNYADPLCALPQGLFLANPTKSVLFKNSFGPWGPMVVPNFKS